MYDAEMTKWSEKNLPGPSYRQMSEFTITVLCMWLAFGVSLIVAGFVDWSPSLALVRVPGWLELFLGLAITGGTAFTLLGVVPRPKLASDRWAREMGGLTLAAVGWLSFTVTTFVVAPLQMLPWIAGSGFATASILRAIKVWRVSKHTRVVKRHLDRRREETEQ